MQEDLGLCPSFNCYSTNGIVDTARRVGREFSGGSCSDCSISDFRWLPSMNRGEAAEEEEEEEDFEFVSLQKNGDGDVFCYGPISVFPIFNYDVLFEEGQVQGVEVDDRHRVNLPPIRIPLEKLIIRDRDDDPPSPSSSSSEVDELEGVPSGTYCVWKPKSVETPNVTCKKSRSTGSSSTKRWGIRNLLRRSHSDGKNSYISFTPSSTANSTKKTREGKTEQLTKNLKEKKNHSTEAHVAAKTKARTVAREKKVFSAHESFYVRNRTLKEEGRRKSYLPYKQDLVGCWTNISGSGKISPPLKTLQFFNFNIRS